MDVVQGISLAWVLLLIFFCALELATTMLVSIWFCVGALVAFIMSLSGFSLAAQIVAFTIVSIVCIFLMRPIAQKVVNKKATKTNADRIIGMHLPVVETINNLESTGAVKAYGVVWTARSIDDSIIEKGATIKAESIEGAKLIVSRIPPKSIKGKDEET